MKKYDWTRMAAVCGLIGGMALTPAAFAAKDVTLAVNIALESLDPYNTNSTLNQAVGKAYYEGLFEFDQNLQIRNLLAESYEVSDDGLTYIFHLRKGVKFHDGSDFNAQAVKVNLDRGSNKDNRLARYNQFNRIKSTEVVNEHTVRVTLTEPFSPFLNALAHPSAMMISPAALEQYGKDIAFHPVGTGPFKFVEWRPAEYMKVEKFDGYWREGYPKIDTLTFRTVTDNNTRAAVVQTGEAHFAFPVPYEQAALLTADENLNVEARPSIFMRYLSMNNLVKPFDDVRVRQAVNYAINKQALAKVVFNGYAEPSTGVVPQGVDFAVKMQPWPYDPAKARALLAEAGYPNGFETKLWSAYNDGTSVKAVQFLQQQLAQVGIKTSVEVLESGQRVQRILQVQKPEEAQSRMIWTAWSASTGEADWALRPLLDSGSWPPVMGNYAYYGNPEVDAGIAQALRLTDRDQKAAVYKSVQEKVWNDAPWAFLVTQQNVSVSSKKLTGVHVMPDTSYWFGEIDLKQ